MRIEFKNEQFNNICVHCYSFINSVVAFLRKYDFNGLHLDWNYPVCWQADCTQGPPSDKTNFVKLIQVWYYLHKAIVQYVGSIN